jgi:hypothetical protein
MADWNSLLHVWLYPLAILCSVFDGLSTYLLLEYASGTSEVNTRVAALHDRFGLAKGQAVFTAFATPLWVGGIHLLLVTNGTAITSLAVGLYLGFSLKQLYNGYSAYSSAYDST